MTAKHIALAGIFVVVAAFLACRKDEVLPMAAPAGPGTDNVMVDLDSIPYPKLSQYGFFTGNLAALQPAAGVVPYTVINGAFGDYTEKLRFVWMPAGSKASYVADNRALDFPEGTVLAKTPYYPRTLPGMRQRNMDTRLLIRKNGDWVFAEYIWNEEQTEAFLDMSGRNVPVTWVDDAGQPHDEVFRVPSEGECMACHKQYDERIAISPKPQNLNTLFNYPEGPMNQLAKWASIGYLDGNYPTHIETVARWDDPAETLERRVRGYLDINCSHCHNEGGFCGYRPIRFAWDESADPAHLGICVPPQIPLDPGVDYIVNAGNADRSMLYYRLGSTDESVRMPLLERTVRHEEAIQLVAEWINSMPPSCP